ncbi:hypothetical protein BDZ89DRAFT_1057682 [Hymenopellis radicata]|nr:hypothetical protein BDZ89DRAFT_1057682 [Hymenopellis radicata]
MAGNKKKRKGAQNVLANDRLVKKIKLDAVVKKVDDADAPVLGGLLYADEIETTVDTLNVLVEHPQLISSTALKGFRTAVHDYWRVSTETSMTGNSVVSRVSSALVDHRHVDALVLLSEMHIRGQVPKLGTLQRWVRECDAVLTPDMSREEQSMVWRVLDLILRTTQPEVISSSCNGESTLDANGRLKWFSPFSVPATTLPESSYDTAAIVQAASSAMVVLQNTPGPERRPPNKYAAVIYYSPDTFKLLPPEARKVVPVRHDVPGPGECDAIVQTAENVGLLPDEPISGSAVQLASILAHNLIWLADTKFLDVVYARIVSLLPPEINGGKVKGVNARFRLYRYRPGALYRPHIDGAWPASALDSTTSPASYIYDSDDTVYSRLTMLIYLNDGFEGGCTTYFLPSAATLGVLDARPIRPRKGTVAFFPHGAAKGSLLHEGSGVQGDGVKYVIRTEVLYEVDKKERIVG